MNKTVFTQRSQTGRRGVLASFVAGAAALLSRSDEAEAGRRCRRAAACPKRMCCECKADAPNPGCQYSSTTTGDNPALTAACEKVCGGPGTSNGFVNFQPNISTACNVQRTGCIQIGCPQ